ncbi:MAG: hypothetical protein DJ555_00935 [Desulfurococcaceae archaeon]|nr:MAG: hypothetical protein DJ555_00935 [Desulfurococcaceae archaeon]
MRPKNFSIRVGEKEIEVSWKALEVLRIIRAKGSIRAASEELGLSYRNVIRIVRTLEKEVGGKLIITRRGRGAKAMLTELGEEIVNTYVSSRIEALSARNKIPARVISITCEGLSAVVVAETAPSIVKILITREALNELGIKVNDTVDLVVKASNIAIVK